MKRTLLLRLFTMQLLPLLTAGGLAKLNRGYLGWGLLGACALWALALGLSIRDGAVLARGGIVCERTNNPRMFWFSITIQAALWAVLVWAGTNAVFK